MRDDRDVKESWAGGSVGGGDVGGAVGGTSVSGTVEATEPVVVAGSVAGGMVVLIGAVTSDDPVGVGAGNSRSRWQATSNAAAETSTASTRFTGRRPTNTVSFSRTGP